MEYDVVIIGAGVSGTALLYVLDKYTDVNKIAIIEKHDKVAQVASHYSQNSQTLHYGDIETNYSFEKAKSVSQGAKLVQYYLERVGRKEKIHSKFHKMVLAVGEEECKTLRARFKRFKVLFPKIKLIERKEIAKIEPAIVKGRDKDEEIVALFSPEGYTVDYERLSQSFMKQVEKSKKDIDILMGSEVRKVKKVGKKYEIHLGDKVLKTKFLVADAGAMSIKLAKQVGLGKHLSIFSVAGNFYRGPETLKGKVYTMQKPKLPFAAIHGDPDVRAKGYTRYGPSAIVLFMLERRNYSSIWDYFRVFKFTWDGLISVVRVALDPTYSAFMAKNYLYEIPFIGTRIFAKEVQKIVPSTKRNQVKKDKGYGGTRPQIINTKKREISMGEARIEGENSIFNITPSPGASTCLANARRDAKEIVKALKKKFNEKKMLKDLL